MKDLSDPFWIKFKAVLFLVLGAMTAGLILLEHPSFQLAALLTLAIWSFCRFYYFAFYVIEHYVDPSYRFSGLGSFVKYCWAKGSGEKRGTKAAEEDGGR
jgi:hypothetical protein